MKFLRSIKKAELSEWVALPSWQPAEGCCSLFARQFSISSLPHAQAHSLPRHPSITKAKFSDCGRWLTIGLSYGLSNQNCWCWWVASVFSYPFPFGSLVLAKPLPDGVTKVSPSAPLLARIMLLWGEQWMTLITGLVRLIRCVYACMRGYLCVCVRMCMLVCSIQYLSILLFSNIIDSWIILILLWLYSTDLTSSVTVCVRVCVCAHCLPNAGTRRWMLAPSLFLMCVPVLRLKRISGFQSSFCKRLIKASADTIPLILKSISQFFFFHFGWELVVMVLWLLIL